MSVLCASSVAHATGITEFPDNGSEQGGRGGAWISARNRATLSPRVLQPSAGLAGGSRPALILSSNINFQKTCFNRLKAKNDPTPESNPSAIQPSGTQPGEYFGSVCSNDGAGVDPQLAMTIHVTDRIGVGIAPLLAPSAGASSVSFPAFIPYTYKGFSTQEPGPARYMLNSANLLVLNPTIAIGAEIVNRLRVGASFQWGIASLDFQNVAATGSNTISDNSQDVGVHAKATDFFVPGFTLGALYSPTDDFDIAAWFKWSDSIRASGDITTSDPNSSLAPGSKNPPMVTDSSKPNCGIAGRRSAGTDAMRRREQPAHHRRRADGGEGRLPLPQAP